MTTYGFLGMGIMGSAMAANLVRAGNDVIVWNRTPEGCAPLVEMGASMGVSPRDVVSTADVTFAMVSDPAAVEEICRGPEGVFEGAGPGHDLIDCSTVDDLTSELLAAELAQRGARFLEAPVTGTKQPAIDGTLVFLAAGERSLYDDVAPALDIMGKLHVFLGRAGMASRMKLIINAIMGSTLAALCEGLALAQKSELDGAQLLELLDAGAVSNPMFRGKGAALLSQEYPASFPLKHMQKDFRLTSELSERLGQPIPSIAVANETYKRALAQGYGDDDFSVVFEVVR